MADPVTQRLNYYTGQFLRAEDFALEQSYHVDRQRRHNRFFHTPGVADGLGVDVTIGQSEVVVTPGTAVDGQGREIVLAASRTVTTSDAHAGNEVYIVISYLEETGETKGPGDTRWLEVPRIEFQEASKAPSEETHIRLAKLTLGNDASVTVHDESFLPRRAGVSLRGEAELTRLLLQRVDEAKSRWPALYSGQPNRVDVEGGLAVSGGGSFGGDVAVSDGGLSVESGGMTHFKAGEGFSTRLPRGGWYRIAQLISEEHGKAVRANAVFKLFDTTSSGGHSSVTVRVGASYADRSRMAVTVLNNSGYGRDTFTKLRVLTKGTYDDQYVDVYVPRQSDVSFTLLENTHDAGWSPVEWAEAGDPPAGFVATEYDIGDRLFAVAGEKEHMAVLRNGTTHATLMQGDVVHLGDKWRLSGVGDAHGNDDWLRLFNTANSGYYGGLAAGKLWSGGELSVLGRTMIAANQEIFFGDNGQIRSADDNHRLLFRRSDNVMELREWGEIRFSPGAKAGAETNRVTIRENGDLAIREGVVRAEAGGSLTFKAGEGYATQVPSAGWYRIAELISSDADKKGVRANALFKLFDTTSSGGHSSITLRVGASYADRSRMALTVLSNSGYNRDTFGKLRVITGTTYQSQFVEVYVNRQSNVSFSLLENTHTIGWSAVAWTEGSVPSGATATEYQIGDRLFAVAGEKEHMAVRRDGTTRADVIQLGDKWRMSAIGDAHANDDWLRLFDVGNTGYYGGFAAGRLWTASGGGTLSDERAKYDIRRERASLDRLMTLSAIRFRWRDPEMDGDEHIGLSAQEVEGAFPEVVHDGPDGMKAIDYGALTAPIIEAVKELSSRLAAVEARLRSLVSDVTPAKSNPS